MTASKQTATEIMEARLESERAARSKARFDLLPPQRQRELLADLKARYDADPFNGRLDDFLKRNPDILKRAE